MKTSKKLLILSSTLIATSLPIVTSISCAVKSIEQMKYERKLKEVDKKIKSLISKMGDNSIKKTLIETQKKSYEKLKNIKYNSNEEYKKATKQLQLILDALELIG